MKNASDMLRPAVFLDRDGTIIEEAGYIDHPDKVKLIPGSGRAIRRLNEKDIRVVVLTNQSGVARGMFAEEMVHTINDRTSDLLREEEALLDACYYCPHHPEGTVARYTKRCGCRKPETGMIEKAQEDISIDIAHSYVVGDKITDMELGHNAGMKSVLVLTGLGREEYERNLKESGLQPAYLAENLAAAVNWILDDLGKRSSQ